MWSSQLYSRALENEGGDWRPAASSMEDTSRPGLLVTLEMASDTDLTSHFPKLCGISLYLNLKENLKSLGSGFQND